MSRPRLLRPSNLEDVETETRWDWAKVVETKTFLRFSIITVLLLTLESWWPCYKSWVICSECHFSCPYGTRLCYAPCGPVIFFYMLSGMVASNPTNAQIYSLSVPLSHPLERWAQWLVAVSCTWWGTTSTRSTTSQTLKGRQRTDVGMHRTTPVCLRFKLRSIQQA